MKRLSCLFLILFLLGCEDSFEDTYRYSKIITESKEYPVYLNMSEVGNIQVKTEIPLVAPFKILSNEKYYFVGDMLKGIHVYEKKASGVSYLCFIECRYLKAFELAGNLLFCNNFVDMIVADVSNPQQLKVLHRQKNHFNRFTSYKTEWNIPYAEGKGLIVGSQTQKLTGMTTEKQPNLDFSEYDKMYGNLTTSVIPYSWSTNIPENDKPYVGMIRMGTDEIYTYGKYNSWAICTYRSGIFSVREVDLWTTPRVNYGPPYYYSDAWPFRMFYEDNDIFIMGVGNGLLNGYSDCIVYNESYPISFHMYFPDFKPVDLTYMPQMNAFFVLSGTSIWGAFKYSDGSSAYMESYKNYQITTDAVEIFRAGDKLVTLGKELKVYAPSKTAITLVKAYPGISGTCCFKEGNLLALAGTKGLFLYNISDLENIQLIQ
jgi:hypothetical protein